jgi:saccharopine dehydrogenase-like NADP-dependent oxidoreductase
MPSAPSIARAVTVDVEVTGRDFSLAFRAEWLITKAESHAGFMGSEREVDIPPNATTKKAALFFRHSGESDAYAFCEDNRHAYADWRHPGYRIAPGVYAVIITLRGIGLSSEYRLKFTSPEDPAAAMTVECA